MKNLTYFLGFIIITVIVAISACDKQEFTFDPEDKLSFSIDTLSFDTVFTQIGSTTKFFKVYNSHDQSIIISDIRLAKTNSFFRLNIDGVPINNAVDIEILPNDSIYIFVEVTVDPNQPISMSPFIIEEEIAFITNDNLQKVHLDAWGQNANYIPSKNARGTDNLLSCNLGSENWNDPKPYVIYGRLFIDSCELIIAAGTQIYVHGGIALRKIDEDLPAIRYNDGAIVVFNKGSLTINGTIEAPVTIQGDRLDEAYDDVYGQWVGLYFWNSLNNSITYTNIKNAIRGCYVDSASELSIKSTTIYNTLGAGLEARHAKIDMQNSLIYNNLGSAIQLTYGGDYNFDYCTVVSNNNSNVAFTGLNYTCTDFSQCTDARFYPLNLSINNSILVGNQDDEMLLIDGSAGELVGVWNYDISNCIIDMKEILNEADYDNHFHNCIANNNDDILFIESESYNFHLDTFSIAEKKALPLSQIQFDLDGIQRDQIMPDIGCYEFIE